MPPVSMKISELTSRGVEVLPRPGNTIALPEHTVIEAPSSLKWTKYEHSIELGAFSYQVSGACIAARIGRYCSFGEDVQIGRQSHPTTWASTSPVFYLGDRIFDLGKGFSGGEEYHNIAFNFEGPPTKVRKTTIGNDVYIGHGAFISAGVTIGHGAIVAGNSVVSRDVPPYAVVAGNPAVIKKFRLPMARISQYLHHAWWKFAPWQIQHLDPSNPRDFIMGIAALNKTEEPFQPDIIDLRPAKT